MAETRDLGGSVQPDETYSGHDRSGSGSDAYTSDPGDISSPQDTSSRTGQAETMHPALQAFADALPEDIRTAGEPTDKGDENGPGWLTHTLTRINDWVTGRDVADRSQAHAEEYVKNLGTFKDGLINMVKNDPTSVTVARDVVGPTIKHLVSSNIPTEQQAKVINELGISIQNEVVEAAVNSMAMRSPVLARRMLDSTVGGILSDDQKQALGANIHAQDIAQRADQVAQTQRDQGDAARASAASSHRFGEELLNPGTDGFTAPDGWASRLIADPSVHPEEKGSLMGAFGRMQTAGDVAESNGHMVYDAMKQIKDGTLRSSDLWNATGQGVGGLSIKDAQWINGMMHDESPQGKQSREAFTNALTDARTKLMGKDGSMGAEGRRDFNNYAKWLVGAYRQTGMAGLDPNHDGYLFRNVGTNSFQNPEVVNLRPSQRPPEERQQVSSYFRRAASRRR